MVLAKKWPFFQLLFFRQYRPGKYSFTIFQNEKTPFQAIKGRSSKTQKIDVFQRGQPMVFFKTWPFFQLYFQAIKARKMSFTIFYNEKTPFQAIKTKSSKSQKIDVFRKGLTHGFGPKIAIFPTFFFLGNIGQENVFYDILERENAFLGYKNKKFKKSKN